MRIGRGEMEMEMVDTSFILRALGSHDVAGPFEETVVQWECRDTHGRDLASHHLLKVLKKTTGCEGHGVLIGHGLDDR
jgi:hypothetical protein